MKAKRARENVEDYELIGWETREFAFRVCLARKMS